MGKMRSTYATESVHKAHVKTKIQELQRQEEQVDAYMDKILEHRRQEEYQGIGDREGQRKMAGLFVACQMSQVILERTKRFEEMVETTN